jgi:DNA-directed RNA polymerase, beta subunit/140 kD subunit
VQFDTADLLYIYLDRRKRRRKFLATTFLRALGYGSDEEVIKLFYNIETLKLSDKLDEEQLASKVLTADIRDGEVTVARAFEPLTLATVRQIMALNIHEAKVIDISNDDTVVKALERIRRTIRKRLSKTFTAVSVQAIRRPWPTPALYSSDSFSIRRNTILAEWVATKSIRSSGLTSILPSAS